MQNIILIITKINNLYNFLQTTASYRISYLNNYKYFVLLSGKRYKLKMYTHIYLKYFTKAKVRHK